jgi:hypothetical protein
MGRGGRYCQSNWKMCVEARNGGQRHKARSPTRAETARAARVLAGQACETAADSSKTSDWTLRGHSVEPQFALAATTSLLNVKTIVWYGVGVK